MKNSESIDDVMDDKKNGKSKKNREPSSFQSIFADVMTSLNWKVAIILFLIFIVLSSDLMMNKIFYNIPGAVKNSALTNRGVVIQGVLLVVFYMIIDGLVTADVI